MIANNEYKINNGMLSISKNIKESVWPTDKSNKILYNNRFVIWHRTCYYITKT